MSSFKAYFVKESKEGLRSYRYLIIGCSIIVFGIFDPIMLKLLPKLLEMQSNISIPIEEFMKVTQGLALQNFIKNLTQIVNIVIVLSLMGIISEEMKEKTIVFPYSKGLSNTGMVLGKIANYLFVIPIFILIGFLINYYYSGALFKDGTVEIMNVIKSVGLISLYMAFNIALVLFFSSMSKKSIIAGLSSLGVIFLLPLVGKIFPVKKYLPSYLIQQSNTILSSNKASLDSDLIFTILAIAIYIIVFTILTIYKMNKSQVA